MKNKEETTHVHSCIDNFHSATPSPLEGEGWGEGEKELDPR